jgi:hypothetical protein
MTGEHPKVLILNMLPQQNNKKAQINFLLFLNIERCQTFDEEIVQAGDTGFT